MAVSVKLDVDTDRRLRMLARETGYSHHFIMCQAIKRFVVDEEARLREQRITKVPADEFHDSV